MKKAIKTSSPGSKRRTSVLRSVASGRYYDRRCMLAIYGYALVAGRISDCIIKKLKKKTQKSYEGVNKRKRIDTLCGSHSFYIVTNFLLRKVHRLTQQMAKKKKKKSSLSKQVDQL